MRILSLVLVSLLTIEGCGRSPATSVERAVMVDVLAKEVQADYPDVRHLSARDLMVLLDDREEVLLVDVRGDAERAVSTLPGAISQSDFEVLAEDIGGRTVVAYCTIGVRSSRFAREMKQRGIEVTNLNGSILAWTHAGGSLVAEGQETHRLHVYGPRWDLAAEGYEGVW